MTDGDQFFAWRLAETLGIADPEEMVRGMRSRTFAKWKAYKRAEQVLQKRAEEQAKMGGGH